jgi:hypothetical protein
MSKYPWLGPVFREKWKETGQKMKEKWGSIAVW